MSSPQPISSPAPENNQEKKIVPPPDKTTERSPRRPIDIERQLLSHLHSRKLPTLKQLRHAFKIFNSFERQVVAVSLVLMVASLTWLGIAQATNHLTATANQGGTYTEAIIGQPRLLNPLFASTSSVDMDITRLIYGGLFRYNTDLEIVPDLAESFVENAVGQIYTVRLKDNLQWHDGTPLTIDDVLFTFESIQNKDIQSPLAAVFSGVVIEKIDDHSIRFTLKDAYPLFLHTLTVGIIPKHLWESISTDQWRSAEYNLRPVGAGAWQFDTVSRERDGTITHLTVARAKAQAERQEPFLDKISFRFYPDDRSALEAVRNREAQGMALVNQTKDPQRLAGRNIESHPLALPATTAVFFNLNQKTALESEAVRRALAEAINKNDLATNVLDDQAHIAIGPFPDSTVAETPSDKSAEDLLEAAGWKRVGAIRRNKDDEILSITLTIIDRQPDREVGDFIAEAWKTIGVDVKLDLVSPPTPTTIDRRILKPRSYQALLYTIVYGAQIDPYPFWHSAERVDPGLNLSMYSHSAVDSAIEKYRGSMSDEERDKKLTEIETQIMKDVPAIFLFSPERAYLVSQDVRGIMVDRVASPADRFNGIADWYVKTKRAFQW